MMQNVSSIKYGHGCVAVPDALSNTAALARLIDELGIKDEEQDQRLNAIEACLGGGSRRRCEPVIDGDQPQLHQPHR